MLRAFQWDLARQVERLDWLLAQLPRYADWGYNELYLHLEDAVEYPSLPEIARADAYSYRDLERLVAEASRVGIKVVPIVNLLGHTQYLIKVPALRDLNELRADDGSPLERGQICPLHPRTLKIADALIGDMMPFCTAGKVHVGLDESFHLGQHPLSRGEVEQIGLPAHFARYVGRLRNLAHDRGLKTGLWADMLYFLPEAIPLLPPDVTAYEWYYYGFKRRPKVELFNFRESNVGECLVRQGIEYWGCPMNGAFRYEPLPHFRDRLENILSWWRRCHRLNAAGMLITSWEPYRLAIELTTVVDAAAASLWLDGETDPKKMLERGFARVFGRRGTPKAAARVALDCDKFPFSGYPRWQLNNRWDVVSRREPLGVFRRETLHFTQLDRKATRLPAPLQASVALRRYFAERELWLQIQQRRKSTECGEVDLPARRRAALTLRAELKRGLRAARQMWTQTRDKAVKSPNETILHDDLARLDAWCRGEAVFGPVWQLCYRVDNFAPAVQWVGVEQQQSDGTWKLVQGCHTIEFQARAAQRTHGLTREHAAPISWGGNLMAKPQLRFVVRGVGQIRITRPTLTDGQTLYTLFLKTKILGRQPPPRGFPVSEMCERQLNWPMRIRRAS